MADEKYPNSPREIDFNTICLDPRFGDLKFELALDKLNKMKFDIVELENLDFSAYLTDNEISRIIETKNQLNQFLQQIKEFNLSQSNPQETRDRIQREIINYYNNTFINNTRNSLIFLRQQVQLNKKTEKELQDAVSNAKKIERELRERLDRIKKDEESVEKGSGIISSKFFSKEFEEQYRNSENEANKKWFVSIIIFYFLLFLFVIVNFIVYLFNKDFFREDRQLLIEWGVFCVLIISILFYGLKFCAKSYDICKNLSAVNRHRRNVAETLIGYLESENSINEAKSILVKDASTAMFENQASGYLTQDQMQISTPVKELVTQIIKEKV